MATTVLFEDVVSQVAMTSEAFGSKVADDIRDYAPSIICAKAVDTDEVELIVPEAHELWNVKLEREIRSNVESIRSVTGTPCRLTIRTS